MLCASRFRCIIQRRASILGTDVRWMGRFARPDTPRITPQTWELKQTKLLNQHDAPPEIPVIKPYKRRTPRGHPERPKYLNEYTNPFPKGKVYEKFPLKIPLVSGKIYLWCTCGYSHSQVFHVNTLSSLTATQRFTNCQKKPLTCLRQFHLGVPRRSDGAGGTLLKGEIYEKFPAKIELQSGRPYLWCTCGMSQKQPFCDGAHKRYAGIDSNGGPKFRPHRFKVEESKEYYLCNCKQTDNRPFCDGTHKNLK